MGEIADMMIEGILCANCGVVMDDAADDDFEAPGYPRYCSKECEPADLRVHEPIPIAPRVSCPHCQRRVKAVGLKDHVRAVHGDKP